MQVVSEEACNRFVNLFPMWNDLCQCGDQGPGTGRGLV